MIKKLSILLTIAVVLVNGGIVEEIDSGVSELKPECLTDDQCFESMLNLNNYCCMVKCCTMVSYIFRNENQMGNLVATLGNPRPVNLFLVSLVIVSAIAILFGITHSFKALRTNLVIFPRIGEESDRYNLI